MFLPFSFVSIPWSYTLARTGARALVLPSMIASSPLSLPCHDHLSCTVIPRAPHPWRWTFIGAILLATSSGCGKKVVIAIACSQRADMGGCGCGCGCVCLRLEVWWWWWVTVPEPPGALVGHRVLHPCPMLCPTAATASTACVPPCTPECTLLGSRTAQTTSFCLWPSRQPSAP